MRIALALALVLTWVGVARAEFDQQHTLWQTVLTGYVKDGRVDYAGLKAHPEDLKVYLESLAVADLGGWTRERRVAFWVNAYNAITVQAILNNYPIRRSGLAGLAFPANSIRQISGVWDKLSWRVAGGQVTLDTIENTKLRAELKEPRIHFAIVCASIGCPKLSSTAYTADHLAAQLDAAADAFARDPEKVRLADGKLYLSHIFDWFAGDFDRFATLTAYGKQNGAVSFLLPRQPEAERATIERDHPPIAWLDYDWTLNAQPGR